MMRTTNPQNWKARMKSTTFLWPNRVIGKRESAEIRTAHNALANEHEELVLTLRSAIERVRMANDGGDPILSAWREDAEKLLSRVTSE